MPTYKTHSIHIDKSSKFIDKRIELDNEDLKTFSFGPDTLLFADSNTFNNQHNKDTKYFFECLLDRIKEYKLQDNKEIMAFLYGQLSHFILDISFHPYVNYLTDNYDNQRLIQSHLQLELWLDNHIMDKYNITKDFVFKKTKIINQKARETIDYVYQKIYKCLFASIKYDIGMNAINILEENFRKSKQVNDLSLLLNIGDIYYNNNNPHIKQYLNERKDLWLDPITGEKHLESIQEIWNNSVYLYLETIEKINKYLYDDKSLNIGIIKKNLSYDTAHPCDKEKKRVFSKKY